MEPIPIKEFSITGDEFSVIYKKHSLEVRNGVFDLEQFSITHSKFSINFTNWLN